MKTMPDPISDLIVASVILLFLAGAGAFDDFPDIWRWMKRRVCAICAKNGTGRDD